VELEKELVKVQDGGETQRQYDGYGETATPHQPLRQPALVPAPEKAVQHIGEGVKKRPQQDAIAKVN